MAVSRQTPTTTSHPSGITGSAFATAVNESVAALWEAHGGVLTNIGGTADAITGDIVYSTGLSAYTDGLKISFTPALDGIGATTINLNGLGDRAIKRPNGDALIEGDLIASTVAHAIFVNATNTFVLMSKLAPTVTSGGGVNYVHTKCISANDTWVAPFNCNFIAIAIGGGGGGAGRSSLNGVGGGGAGGCAIKEMSASSGLTLTAVIGAAGAASGNNTSGGAGGSTTLTGTGIALTANGGTGGTTAGIGGTGGAASGGDFNYAGGDGGGSGSSHYGGGGAVGFERDGIAGQDGNSTTFGIGGGLHETSYTVPGFIGCTKAPLVLAGLLGGINGGDGDNFCGGGGNKGLGATPTTGGDGGIGAGGGCASNAGHGSTGAGGAGGQGLVIISWTNATS